jgi:hypothetical protein
VCLLSESDLADRVPRQLFIGHPIGQGADVDAVDGFLVTLARYWTHTARQPPPEAATHFRARQDDSGRATMAWLRERWYHEPA